MHFLLWSIFFFALGRLREEDEEESKESNSTTSRPASFSPSSRFSSPQRPVRVYSYPCFVLTWVSGSKTAFYLFEFLGSEKQPRRLSLTLRSTSTSSGGGKTLFQLRHPRPRHRPLQRARPPAAQQRLRDRVRVADADEDQALCPALRRRDLVCLSPKANPKLDGRGAKPLRHLGLGALCQQGGRGPGCAPRPRRARPAAEPGRAVERQGKRRG